MSKIFLDRTDPTFKVASSNATIYGANGNQIVTIDTGVANIVIDANVEGIQFAGVTSDYKFKQTGNALEIYSSASALITTIGLQDDTNGTQLTFSDGTLDAQFLPTATGLFLKVGTAIISNTTPTAISNGNNVAVNASNTMPFDASAGNVHFTVAEGNYTYSIANFGKGDVLQFPKASTATVSNPVGTDGTVTLQYANNGNIAVVNLSGLTAAQDTSVYSLKSFQDLFGASSIAADTTNSGNSIVSITGSGTTDAATGNLQFNVTPGEYAYTIANFGKGDVLKFPGDINPTINNISGTDGNIDVQWADGRSLVVVNLTGLTTAQDTPIYSLGAFNGSTTGFGAGSII